MPRWLWPVRTGASRYWLHITVPIEGGTFGAGRAFFNPSRKVCTDRGLSCVRSHRHHSWKNGSDAHGTFSRSTSLCEKSRRGQLRSLEIVLSHPSPNVVIYCIFGDIRLRAAQKLGCDPPLVLDQGLPGRNPAQDRLLSGRAICFSSHPLPSEPVNLHI